MNHGRPFPRLRVHFTLPTRPVHDSRPDPLAGRVTPAGIHDLIPPLEPLRRTGYNCAVRPRQVQVQDRRPLLRVTLTALVCAIAALSWNRVTAIGEQDLDWPVYRGDPKGNQYSPLAQIHAGQRPHGSSRAWEYRTGDANQRSTMHANPIVVNGVMYVTTPSLKAVALNAATGTRDLVVRSRQVQQRQRRPAAQPRRRLLEGDRGRADLPLRPRPRLRGRREDRRADHVVRHERLHRSPAEPRRRSGDGGHRDDVARRGVQELPDHRVARQRELRRVARPHPRATTP